MVSVTRRTCALAIWIGIQCPSLCLAQVARSAPKNGPQTGRGKAAAARPPSATAPMPAAAPASQGDLQAEYARLAQLLNTGDKWGKEEAAKTLLLVNPKDVSDPEVRKLIARGYRSRATDSWGPTPESIRGLVIWGGKFSAPILVDLMEKNRSNTVSTELFDALAAVHDPRGAEVVVKKLGNYFNHEAAANSLRKMGSAAEDALIAAAPSGDAKVSLAAVQLLGDVGSEKSLPLLEKAAASRNAQVKTAARESMKKIRLRQQSGKSADADLAAANSAFLPPSGPPLDLLALKAKAAAATTAGHAASSRASRDSQEPELTAADKGDWSAVKVLKLDSPNGAGMKPDPTLDATDTSWSPKAAPLAEKPSANEQPVCVDVRMSLAPAAVVIHRDAENPQTARLERLDLKDGKSIGSVNIPGGENMRCYIAPSGQRVLILSQRADFRTTARLDVWDIGGEKPVERATWYPYFDKPRWTNAFKWAGWISDDQFLTLNGDSSLVCWVAAGGKAKYQIDNSSSTECAALSPGRSYLLLPLFNGLAAVRTKDGALVERLTKGVSYAKAMAFSADGQRLATVSDKTRSGQGSEQLGQASVYEIPSGNLLGQVPSAAHGSIEWLDNNLFLVSSRYVLGLGMYRPLWMYESASNACIQVGPWRWMAADGKLIPFKLPHDAALAAKNAGGDDLPFLFKPGTKVSVEVTVSQEADTIRTLITNAIQKRGMEIGANESLRLVAGDRVGQSKQMTYQKLFGRGKDSPNQTVSYTERSYWVTLKDANGKELWSWGSLISPSFRLELRPGESAQQYVDRQMAAPLSTHFEKFELPDKLVDPRNVTPIGTSKLTANGIE
jgi:hypothetical protein